MKLILGYDPADMINSNAFVFFHPGDLSDEHAHAAHMESESTCVFCEVWSLVVHYVNAHTSLGFQSMLSTYNIHLMIASIVQLAL